MKSKTISILLMFALSALIILPMSILAGTTGKLSGKVVSEETGEPLPGVAVSIVGTVMGGLTDENGEYFILNVPVGDYTVKASLIGYAPVEMTDVHVSVDLTTYNDYSLSKKALELGKTIIVTSQRPLIIKDKTATIKIIETEDIENISADDPGIRIVTLGELINLFDKIDNQQHASDTLNKSCTYE